MPTPPKSPGSPRRATGPAGGRPGRNGARGHPAGSSRPARAPDRRRGIAPAGGHPLPPRGRRPARSRWWTVGPIAVVLVAVAAILVAYVSSGGPSSARASAGSLPGGTGPVPASVASAATSVSLATLARVGTPSGITAPTGVSGSPPALTGSGGKPELLYVGADYCPYCAAERWALVVALSHFGTFSGLHETYSSLSDVFPGTRTFSFFGSSYQSRALDFVPVELSGNQLVNGRYPPLQSLTPAQKKLMDTYDRPPYSSSQGAIPFIDLANRYVMVGSSYDPSVLSGLTMEQIAGSLSNPDSPVARSIDGAANALVSQITSVTGIRPTG